MRFKLVLSPILERNPFFQMVGEVFFVWSKSWTNKTVKAEFFHFFSGFLGCPAFVSHAVSGDHHSRAIVAITAMNEDLFVTVVSEQLQKFCEYFIMGEHAVPL